MAVGFFALRAGAPVTGEGGGGAEWVSLAQQGAREQRHNTGRTCSGEQDNLQAER